MARQHALLNGSCFYCGRTEAELQANHQSKPEDDAYAVDQAARAYWDTLCELREVQGHLAEAELLMTILCQFKIKLTPELDLVLDTGMEVDAYNGLERWLASVCKFVAGERYG